MCFFFLVVVVGGFLVKRIALIVYAHALCTHGWGLHTLAR